MRLSDHLSDRSQDRAASRQVRASVGGGTANDTAARSAAARRITPARLLAIAERLDERELTIVQSVSAVRLLSGRQIERWHFAGVPSADRQARRVLRRLEALDVLVRLDRRVGGRTAGSASAVFALSLVGQRLAGGRGPAGGHRTQRPWTPSAPYVAHLLAVAEIAVQLVEADRAGRLVRLEYEAEPACWRPFLGRMGERLMLKPDAFVRIGVGDAECLSYVEVDLATESPRTLLGKFQRYREFVDVGGERERWGVHPRVVWLVPDERRRTVLDAVHDQQPPRYQRLFTVGLLSDAVTLLAGGQS